MGWAWVMQINIALEKIGDILQIVYQAEKHPPNLYLK